MTLTDCFNLGNTYLDLMLRGCQRQPVRIKVGSFESRGIPHLRHIVAFSHKNWRLMVNGEGYSRGMLGRISAVMLFGNKNRCTTFERGIAAGVTSLTKQAQSALNRGFGKSDS